MILTTTPDLQGHKIERYIGIVTGETITGVNVVRDLLASLRDFFGGRSASYEKELETARQAALREMQEKAARLGADAVLGIDIDYEVLGNHNSMLMVCVSGTAVKLTLPEGEQPQRL